MNDRATIVVSARTGEIVLCLVFAALAGYVMFAASRMPMGSYTLPGPGVFPLALGVMLAVASLARVAWQFARPGLERDTVALGHVNIVIAVAALCGVALALEALGFIVTMGAFLAVLFAALARREWWRAIVSAAVAVVCFYYFFDRFIGVTLPMGRLISR